MKHELLSISHAESYRALMKTFGDVAKERRKRRFDTQRAFADHIDKDPSWVSRLENDEIKQPPLPDEVEILRRELGISPEETLRAWGYKLTALPEPGAPRPLFPEGDVRAEIVDALTRIDPHRPPADFVLGTVLKGTLVPLAEKSGEE